MSVKTSAAATVTWRAGRDGVGHALPKGVPGYTRYLCNRMPIGERFAWPVKERCGVCMAALGANRG